MAETHYYCGSCKRLMGTIEFSRCPYCGQVFNTTTDMGTIVRTVTKTKIDTKLLKYTVVITLGVGTCMFSTSIVLSQVSQEWATFFSSLASTLVWQAKIIAIFFAAFLSVFWSLFWDKIDDVLLKLNRWTLYSIRQKLRKFFYPIARYRRVSKILILLIASSLVLPLTAWKFNRSLDIYDVIISLGLNLVSDSIFWVIGDLINQKEQIRLKDDWRGPPTVDDWERMKDAQ